MPIPEISLENMNSPFAEQLSNGFARLQFRGDLEREFREFFTQRNAMPGRVVSIAMLGLVLIIAAADALSGRLTSGLTLPLINVVLLCPLLTLFVVALHLKRAEQHYSSIATTGITLVGLVFTYMCVLAAVEGASYMFAGLLLLTLYASPLLGLLFYHRIVMMTVLVSAYIGIAWRFGISPDELLLTSAMYVTAALIGTWLAYNREYSLRMQFLETRLLNELAERDGLTGLYNRRIFDSFMRRVWRQSRREESAVQIVLVDIDHFKIYNDLYGHQSGDDTLKRVARCISRYAKRPFDFCARYGGEEFALVIYGTPVEYARSVPEQIRRDVMDLGILHEGSSVSNCVTVSIGVAIVRASSGRSLAGAIQAADEALYQAKRAGRNRIVSMDANISEVETGNFRVVYRELV